MVIRFRHLIKNKEKAEMENEIKKNNYINIKHNLKL